MSSTTHGSTPYYFVPGPSRHPAMAALGLFFVILGAGQWINGVEWGKYSLFFGLAWWLGVLYQWFRDAVTESEGGLYGYKVDLSFRWSMSWFIFSEVMFFGAFFTALWWTRTHSVPALGSLDNALLWPNFQAVWPSVSAGATASPAGIVEPFQTMGPFWLPTINTALLLSSAVTLTIAHHALQQGQRAKTIGFMWVTVILGIIFLCVQGYEYYHAYNDLNLKLSSGVYRLHLLHADRFPRLSRVRRHADAAVHHPAADERALHGRPPFRLRRRGLVLALRGRGLAGPLHPRLLDVTRASRRKAPEGAFFC